MSCYETIIKKYRFIFEFESNLRNILNKIIITNVYITGSYQIIIDKSKIQ